MIAAVLAQDAALSDTGQWVANVFFYVMAAVAIVAALKLVTTANVVHAALYLLVVLSGHNEMLGGERGPASGCSPTASTSSSARRKW